VVQRVVATGLLLSYVSMGIGRSWVRRHVARALLAGCALALAVPLQAQPAGAGLTVFAAASLQGAFEDIGRLHQQQGLGAVRFAFGASSTLARQIEQGAPAAVFASADEAWMDHLAQRRLVVAATRRTLLGNRLVLVVPATSPAQPSLKPGVDLGALLGRDGRWVTGDPAHVPLGRYAQQALTHLGAWGTAQTRLVRAENARVALAFVERGEAAAGVVYETDARLSPRVRVAGVFPADSHAPIGYPVAAVAAHDTPAARAFLRLLESEAAHEVFRRHGFTVR
jgi:molybdate transport system substrate-binding protein